LTFKIHRINKTINRKSFDCGVKPLNEYFQKHARQNDEKGIGSCFVALDGNGAPVGYYVYSMAEVLKSSLPLEKARGIPGYPIGAIRIGRLARDTSVRGKGLGDLLLKDCLGRIASLSENPDIPGFRFIVVDAKDQHASNFYQKFGFIPFLDQANALFIPLETVKRANQRQTKT